MKITRIPLYGLAAVGTYRIAKKAVSTAFSINYGATMLKELGPENLAYLFEELTAQKRQRLEAQWERDGDLLNFLKAHDAYRTHDRLRRAMDVRDARDDKFMALSEHITGVLRDLDAKYKGRG